MTKRRSQQQSGGLTRRKSSRVQREARQQRSLLIFVGIVAVAVIGLLSYGVINETVIKPNKAIVQVGENKITPQEFEDRVWYDYIRIAGGYPLEQFNLTSESFANITLDKMINELVIEYKAQEAGITVSEEEVQAEFESIFFAPPSTDSGDDAATPTPTMTPTFVYTLTPFPTATLEPGVTPTATLEPSPTPSEPTPTPIALPTAVSPTREEIELNFQETLVQLSGLSGLPVEQVEELLRYELRISLLQKQLAEIESFPIDEAKPMYHAAHILVDTEEEALDILAKLEEGEEFELLAAEFSNDSSAFKGGDLGWFDENVNFVEPFKLGVLSLEAGEISAPIQSEFGWHIIKLYAKESVPTTETERESQLNDQMYDLLLQWREEIGVDIDESWVTFVPALP